MELNCPEALEVEARFFDTPTPSPRCFPWQNFIQFNSTGIDLAYLCARPGAIAREEQEAGCALKEQTAPPGSWALPPLGPAHLLFFWRGKLFLLPLPTYRLFILQISVQMSIPQQHRLSLPNEADLSDKCSQWAFLELSKYVITYWFVRFFVCFPPALFTRLLALQG